MSYRIDVTKIILSRPDLILASNSPRVAIIEWLNQNVGPSMINEDTSAEHFDDYIGVGWRFGRTTTTTTIREAGMVQYYAITWYVEIEDHQAATFFALRWG